MPVLCFRYLEIDSKKLNITLFRQLPIVPLCDDYGRQDESLAPIGTVRYKQDGVVLWALAAQGERIVRCALQPELRSRKYLEEQLEFWVRHSKLPHNQSRGEDSVSHKEAERFRLAIDAEPTRFAAHSAASELEQIFL